MDNALFQYGCKKKKKKKKTLMDENCFIALMQNKIILS